MEKLYNTFQSQTCPQEKVMVNVWSYAVDVIYRSFQNSGETITTERYYNRSNRQPPQHMWPELVIRNGLITTRLTTDADEVEPTKLQHSTTSTILAKPCRLPNISFSSSWNNFLREKYFKNQENFKNDVNNFVDFKILEFYVTGRTKFVSNDFDFNW